MELVPLPRAPRSQSRRRSAYEEPLLFDGDDRDEFVDEWLSPGRSNRRRHRRRQPIQTLNVPALNYHPPKPSGGLEHDGVLNYPSRLYYNGPSPPSLSRAVLRQTPARTTSTTRFDKEHNHMKHGNPVVDMGGFFSYGFACMQCVRTNEVGITENFGQFQELLEPGFYCMMWPLSDIAGRLSLRIQQLDVICETKTKDNVFLHVKVSVPFRVIVQKAYDAYYRLTNPSVQIKSYVFDVVRSTVPRLTIDEVFVSKTTIAASVWKRLHEVMEDYGYEILQTLVTDISPDPLVKASMNEINATKKLKEAMPHQAEAEKTRIVKKAEAAAETAYLSGVGSANERTAIAKGMKECVTSWLEEKNVSPKDVMDLLLLTQYIDTLAAVGSNEIVLRSGPGEVFALRDSLPTTDAAPDLLW